jgi:hypothetical protein
LKDHSTIHNDVQMSRRGDRWLVTGYTLVSEGTA